MMDYQWHLDLSPEFRLFLATVAAAFIALPLWLSRGDRRLRTFRRVWTVLVLLATGPAILNMVPHFIDLRGSTLRFNRRPFPASDSLPVAEIGSVRESRQSRGGVVLHVETKGNVGILAMPRPAKEAEFQKLLAALRSRGIPVTTLEDSPAVN